MKRTPRPGSGSPTLDAAGFGCRTGNSSPAPFTAAAPSIAPGHADCRARRCRPAVPFLALADRRLAGQKRQHGFDARATHDIDQFIDRQPVLLDEFQHRQKRLAVAHQKTRRVRARRLPLLVGCVADSTPGASLFTVRSPRFCSDSKENRRLNFRQQPGCCPNFGRLTKPPQMIYSTRDYKHAGANFFVTALVLPVFVLGEALPSPQDKMRSNYQQKPPSTATGAPNSGS